MPSRLFSSSIGSKLLIALTGLGLFIFLIGHLTGNLLFIVSPDAFNQYGHTMVNNPLIYAIEFGLAAIFLLHIVQTIRLYAGSKSARPVPYVKKQRAGRPSRKNLASSTMIATGITILAFVVLHLRAFKFGAWYEGAGGIRDLYRLQLEIFSSPGYVAFYMLSMVLIGFHLWHGVPSFVQSLGFDHPTYTPRVLWGGRAVAVVIAGGFFFLPLYTYLIQGL
jgi:succinate dehydrogenase / fumarate reductase cytochrome b subunit